MDKETLLLVEDDYALAMGTVFVLESEGYQVRHAKNLKSARDMFDRDVRLIILDVMLPDGSGYDFCRELRGQGADIPILFLTAMSEEANIVQGLELGADDYIAKPYRIKELMSRIRANIRRYDMSKKGGSQEYIFGKHRFRQKEFRLYEGERMVECTPSELRLLMELIKNEGVVMTRSSLLDKLYDMDGVLIDDNTLSVYMKRLRLKLGEDATHIETVRGVGYRFNKEVGR
jgi:DNA-binding response OmpR family regulator